jgi:hypothetical protein
LFERISTELEAYWLGFIYADGSIRKDCPLLSVGLQKRDKNHLEDLQRFFDAGTIAERKLYYNYTLYSKSIVPKLIKLGVVSRKTYENSASIFTNIDNHLKQHFIRGFFDGDGTIGIYRNRAQFGFVSLNNDLLTSISSYLSNELNLDRLPYYDTKYTRLVYTGNPSAYAFGQLIYNNCNVYMSRKKDIFDRITKIIRITFDQLNEIKQSKLSTYKLAKEYGVSNSYIWHVKQGNVKGEYHEYQLAK